MNMGGDFEIVLSFVIISYGLLWFYLISCKISQTEWIFYLVLYFGSKSMPNIKILHILQKNNLHISFPKSKRWGKGEKVDWLDNCLLHETTLIEYLNVFSRGDSSNTTESVIRLGYYI